METLKTIAIRKSTRSYKPEQITAAELDTILKAACAAPVGMGAFKTLHLTVVQNAEALAKLVELAQAAAVAAGRTANNPLYGAPTLVLICAEPATVPGLDMANAGCIAENMMLAATDLGLGSVYLHGAAMTVANNEELRTLVQIPEGFNAIASVALGYPTEPLTEERDLGFRIEINRV